MLDKIQVAALRRADDVSFHRTREGRSFIRATKRIPSSVANPFAHEVALEIECTSHLTDYSPGKIADSTWHAFDMIGSARHCPEWQTTASMLRDGDSLELHWNRGAWTNQNMRDHDLFGDYLSLRVQRGQGTQAKYLAFQVGHCIGPDNLGRMIRLA